MSKNKKVLLVELIPSTCHFSNVRTTVKTKDWDKIRFISYAVAGNVCEICGDTGKNQGYKHNVECHEIWDYDDKNYVQKLIGLISLCPTCHQVKHIGRAIAIGKQKEAYRQLAKVNGWSQAEIDNHVVESFKTYAERSKHEWSLDINILKEEPYCLVLKKSKARVFEVKKYKKKRKNKGASKRKKKKGVNKRPPKK